MLESLKDNNPTVPPLDIPTVLADQTEQQPQGIVFSEPVSISQLAPVKKNPPFILIFTSLAALFLLVALIAQLVLYYTNPVQPTIANEFENCINSGQQASLQGSLLVCVQNGKVTTSSPTQSTFARIEQESAALGVAILSGIDSKRFDNYTVSSLPNVGNLGIRVYSDQRSDNIALLVVNNSFLRADQTYNNDFAIQKVRAFLQKSSEFTVAEPLGQESLVLKAFQKSAVQDQSKTFGELEATVRNLESVRTVWGADGIPGQQYMVTARLFGSVRDSVVMLQVSLSHSAQVSLEKTVLVSCQQKFRASADVENCFHEEVKKDASIKSSLEQNLRTAATNFGF